MRIPTYDQPQAAPTALPFTPENDGGSAQVAAQAGRVQQGIGQGLMQAGETANSIAIDVQEQANQVQVNAAANAARKAELDLTFNPQTGYKNLKGDAALTRPDGQALPDEYGDKLKTSLAAITDGLGNEAQRRLFGMQAANMLTSFKGDVEGHMLGEFRNHALSVQDGTIKIGVDTAKLNWDNPDKIIPAVNSVKAAVVEAGRISGEAASETMAKLKVATSAVHIGVIESALQNNNPEYALKYLKNNKDGMTADDLLRTRGAVNQDVYARAADDTATNVVGALRAKIQPTDADRVVAITMQTESSGARDAVGRFIPGQGTAKGDMQVMDATNGKPGYGVAPAKDNSPEERSRVGREYIGALVKEYAGDMPKAWAAYNWGPGNLNAAVKANGDNWLAGAPKETQSYVAKNMAALNSGGGTPARPTLQDVHDGIRSSIAAQFGATPPMGVLNNALQAGTKQWEDLNKSLTAQGDTAVMQAQQWLISNGGDFTKLPANLTTAVTQSAPGKMDDLSVFAKHIAKGENLTNMVAYTQAVTYPEELAKMSDGTFQHLLTTSFSMADQEKIARMRADEINNPDQSAGSVNNKAFNTVFNFRAEAMGLAPPKPNDSVDVKARFGALQKFARDSIYDQQQQIGRKMTGQEIEQHVDGLFAKNVTFRTSWAGIPTGTSQQPLLSVQAGDIPGDTRAALKASFARRGVANPSDSDMLGAYLKWKQNGK